ncbi:MAG: hypothetical protein QOE61_2861 [Micromonosporaceae bacterium]|jgi:hypothetical protein|nr:hypothetical protein [Micromonosporaceae bacterium]
MIAELTYQHLRRVVRVLTPPAGHRLRRLAQLGLTVSGGQVSLTSGTPDLAGRVNTDGGLSDGHITVDLTGFTQALTAVAPTGRGAASAIVGLHTELGQLHLRAASTAVIATTDTVHPTPALERGDPLAAVPVRDWLAALGAVIVAAETKRPYPRFLRDVRLWRETGCCLVVEASDTCRAHRVVVGEPAPGSCEARLPAASTRAVAGLLGLAPEGATVHIGHCGELLVCDTGTITVAARTTGETSWPELERVFETVADADLTVTTDLTAMADTARRAALAAGRTPVDLDIDPATPALTITVPGPAGQPPRMHLPVPVHTASGPAVHTTVFAEHLLHLCAAAGAGETTVRVNTTSNLLGITRGRFSGAVVHLRQQRASSTSDSAATPPIGEM